LKAYLISGLGADERVFSRIKLPPGYDPVPLNWILPVKDESLEDYAKRFSARIDPTEDFILIGVSFGGMLASEIAKIVPPKKLIIISSVSCYDELPWYFKRAGKLGLQGIITPGVYKRATLINRFMGAGDREMKQIVYDYVRNASPDFIKWALNAILHWQHHERNPRLIHIQGSNDHLLPNRYVKADYVIHQGGHMMVFNRAGEINEVLKKILS
jgi:pimeloyl-ACP methyl ester carboxylesterase